MVILILIALVIVVFLIAFIVAVFKGVCQGVKRVNKIKNLQSNSDVAYTTKNGGFTFKYAFKKYTNEKKLVIIIVPELPLSAWKANMMYANQGVEADVTLTELNYNTSSFTTIKMEKLEQRLEVELDERMLDADLKINLQTKWLFADDYFYEELDIVLENK